MVHLICLRCNRANAAEAKFCTECGAGLLRKFCKSCHAANDSSAHFCQSCGAPLRSAAEMATALKGASPAPREDFVPSLTDVVSFGPMVNLQPAPSLPLAVAAAAQPAPPDDARWAAPSTAIDAPAGRAPRPVPAVAVLAIGVATVLPLALWFWPAADKPAAGSPARSAATMAPMVPAAAHGTTAGDRSGDAASAAAEVATRLSRADAGPPSTRDGAASADPLAPQIGPGDMREPARSAVKRALVEPAAVGPRVSPRASVVPVAAAAARATRAEPATAPGPAAPRECTPTMEALALCAAATNSTGR